MLRGFNFSPSVHTILRHDFPAKKSDSISLYSSKKYTVRFSLKSLCGHVFWSLVFQSTCLESIINFVPSETFRSFWEERNILKPIPINLTSKRVSECCLSVHSCENSKLVEGLTTYNFLSYYFLHTSLQNFAFAY